MKLIISCLKGLEDVCINEIHELISKKAKKVANGRVTVSCKDARKLSLYLRSGLRICALLSIIKFKAIKDIAEESLKFSKQFRKPILVRCSRQGMHDFNSSNVEKAVGNVLFKSGLSVDLANPATTIIIDIIGDECFIGSLISDSLNKRDYRIRATGQSINATICYGMVKLVGYKKGKTLLDLFSKDGTIAIEAAAFISKLPLKYEKPANFKSQDIYCFDPLLYNVNNSETNAKLAGVNKLIKFSRYDIEWLDTRFNKNELDCIVTVLPSYPQDRKKDFERLVKELLYQSEFILSKKGKMALLSILGIKPLIEKFKIESERVVTSGNMDYAILILTRA